MFDIRFDVNEAVLCSKRLFNSVSILENFPQMSAREMEQRGIIRRWQPA